MTRLGQPPYNAANSARFLSFWLTFQYSFIHLLALRFHSDHHVSLLCGVFILGDVRIPLPTLAYTLDLVIGHQHHQPPFAERPSHAHLAASREVKRKKRPKRTLHTLAPFIHHRGTRCLSQPRPPWSKKTTSSPSSSSSSSPSLPPSHSASGAWCTWSAAAGRPPLARVPAPAPLI